MLSSSDEKSREVVEQPIQQAIQQTEKKLKVAGSSVQMLDERIKQRLLRLKEDNAEYVKYIECVPEFHGHGLRAKLLGVKASQEKNAMKLVTLLYLDASIPSDWESSLNITLNRNGTITLGRKSYQVWF